METQVTKADSRSRRRSGLFGIPTAIDGEEDSTASGQVNSERKTGIRAALWRAKTEDGTYQPLEQDVVEGNEDAEEDSEIAALAWGLITTGGLGVGSTAVYGAGMIS